jgi:type III pantothenate kinase
MLLAIDVGNTNIVLGVYDGERLLDHWRLATWAARTSDEYSIAFHSLFAMSKLEVGRVTSAIMASVVPAAVEPLRWALEQRLGVRPLIVGPGVKSGMPILYENPKEVGADRIVNAVAAYAKYRPRGVIVVDFGTATTFDCVSPAGEYLGGVISPGIVISADALYRHAAKLPRVEVTQPPQVIGRNTVASIQAGLFYGYVGLVDGIVRRMIAECGFAGAVRVVATGGQARLIARASETIEEADDLLTLSGLKIIHDLNRASS